MSARTLAVAAMVVLLACVVCGCGKRVQQATQAVETARDARDGDFTVKGEKGEKIQVQSDRDKQSGTVTVTSGEGTTVGEYGKDKVTEEEVGVAFYPGAEVESAAKSTSTGESKGQFATVSLTTTAGFAEVAQFYKGKYSSGNTVIEQPDSLAIMMKAGENAGKMVMVSTQEGKTQIVISQATGQ